MNSGYKLAKMKRDSRQALALANYKFLVHPGASNWNAVIDAMTKFQAVDNSMAEYYATIGNSEERTQMREYLETIINGVK